MNMNALKKAAQHSAHPSNIPYKIKERDILKKKNYYWFTIPLFIISLCIFIFPIIHVFYLSVFDYHAVFGKEYIGLTGFKEVLQDLIFIKTIGRTIIYMIFVVFCNMLIGLTLAMLTQESNRINKILRSIFVLPILFIPAAAAVIWGLMYNEQIGIINTFLRSLGFSTKMWLAYSKSGFFAVMIADIWGWTPFVYLMLLSGLQSLPVEPYEAAKVDGVNDWQSLRFLTIPLLKPVISTTIIIKALDTFRNFTYMWIMTRGGPANGTHTLSTYIYANAFTLFKYGKGATMSVITILLGFLIVYLLYIVFDKKNEGI